MTESIKPISPLRQRMLDDMAMRKLSPKTQKGYVRSVKRFVHFFGRVPTHRVQRVLHFRGLFDLAAIAGTAASRA